MSFSTLASQDLGWHLKTGEWIIKNLQIPHHDFYDSPTPENPWIDLHWGFQVFLYLIKKTGGLLGLNLFRSGLLLLIYFVLYRMVGKRNNPWITSAVFLLSSLAAQERFQMRPELLTFLFMVLDMAILESWLSKKNQGPSVRAGKIIWCIPLIQIIWTNVEGLFMIGPVLVLVYFIGEWWGGHRSKQLAILFGITLLACFINPYGLDGFLFPFTLLKEISLKGTNPFMGVGEFYPPLALSVTKVPTQCFLALLGLITAVCIIHFKKMKRTHLILFTAFSALALLAQRNIGLFAFPASFILLKYLQIPALFLKRIFHQIGLFFYLLACTTLILGVTSNHFYIRDLRPERFGLGIAPEIYPQGAIHYLLKNDIHGRVFNCIDLGPAIIYLGWPNLQPFIDTRLELQGYEKFQEYLLALQKETEWKRLEKKYDIRCVLMDHLEKGSLQLIEYLSRDPDWKWVYFDEYAVVFLRKEIAKDQELTDGRGQIRPPLSFYLSLRKWIPRLVPEAKLPYEIGMARLYLALGNNLEAKRQYLRVLNQLPQWAEAWINLAYLAEKENKPRKSISLLEEAIQCDSKSYQAHFNLGNLYFKTGQYRQAAMSFNRALKIKKTPQALHNRDTAQKFLEEQG